MTEYKRIQLRRDTAANWQTENPVLLEGEIGIDLTNNNIKIGDGSTAWNVLDYVHSDVDLSNYYTKGETNNAIQGTRTALEGEINAKVDNDTYQAKVNEIETNLEGKADKADTYTKGEVDEKIAGAGVSKEYVDGEISRVESEIPSLSGYATEAWVEGKGYLTEHQSLDNYYTKEEIDVKQQAIDNAISTKADAEETANRFSSVDDYLEQLHTDVEEKADASSVPTKTSELENDSNFLTEHQSLEGYATEQWVEGKGYLTEHQSLDNYYTKTETDTAIQGVKETLQDEINVKVDTNTYEGKISEIEEVLDGKADRTEIPSLAGYATEQWVEDKGYLTEHQSLDNYYTKGETDNEIQSTKTALEGEINSKADIEDVPTYTTELTLVGRYDTTNLEVYAKEPQGIIPPNNEIWYKTTDGEYVDIINNMVFYNITNESGEEITHSVQYEDDGDLHKWIFSDDVYNVEFEWRNFELNNRITDIFIPSKVNDLFWRYQGETLKHIVFGGNTLGINMDISSDSILELYRNERIFIDGNLNCLVKVPSEFLEEYKRYLPTTRFEAIGDIVSIATTDYVETAIGVVYNFNIASGNEYELIEQARAILQGIIRGEKVIVEYRNSSNTQLVTLSYDYIVSVENNQIDLGIHNYNETNQNTWHFYGSDLYSLVMQTTFLQIPSNTETWTFELEDGSTITKEIYVR